MRVLPILMAAAIGAAVSTAAFAQQAGPGSNQPPGQATTTQSSEQKMDASGKPMKDHGKYVEIFKKQADGTWKVVADIWNSDLPVAPAEKK